MLSSDDDGGGGGVITNPKGTQLETATVRWFREHGWPNARRIVKEGVRDKGDVTLGDGIPVTIEAKNTKAINLAGAQRELMIEMGNAGTKVGFVIHKKRGTTDVGDYYAVLPVSLLNKLLWETYANDEVLARMRANVGTTPRRRQIPRR